MPSTKLRSASSLLAERHRDEEDSQPQDESFHAPPHSAPNSVDGPDFDLDDDDEEEEEEGGGGGGRGEGVSIQSDSDDSDDDDTSDEDDQEVGFDAEHAALVPHQASPAGDAPMVDAPSSGHSTPWFDHLHSLNISHSPGLTFGLQLATPSSSSSSSSSNSSHDTSDHEMSDNDGGGASLSDPAVGEGNHQVNVAAQTAQSHHNDATEIQQDGPPGNLIVPGMQPGSFILGNNGNSVVAGPAMLFGFAQGGIQIQPPGPWNGPNNPPTFFETSPAPAAPAHLPPAGPNEDDLQPLMPSSTNSMILGSENVGLVDFLRFWAHRGAPGNARTLVPDIREIHAQANANVKQVTYDDLHGDHCDMQGLDWAGMGTTRAAARTKRHLSYKNYVNKEGSDCWTSRRPDTWIPPTESYFRFRRMTMRSDVRLAHFQLRSVLACPSRSQVYYPCSRGINRFNPISKTTELALSLGEFPALGRAITTLDADCGVLVGGTFNGDFVVRSLYSEDKKFSEGLITGGVTGITNHLQVHTQRRSSSPVAAISSNDHGFRILDIQTEQFIADFLYHFPLNCSAVSPDRRLRVLVGDSKDVTITNAETGETEVELTGHRDYGFACDWSEDGRMVATGFQDKSVKIWDSRKWTDSRGAGTPVASIWCDIAGARSLRFSPLGGGQPVLVAAEEADYINVIDARTFEKKQPIDIFGEIGGVAFSDEGRELNVLVSDPHRGGLLQFERCGLSKGGRLPSMIERMAPF